MKKSELVIVPSPGIGHLVSTIEFSNRLLHHATCHNFSITILVISPPYSKTSPPSSDDRIKYVHLPRVDPPSPNLARSPENFITVYIESYKCLVKDAIANLVSSDSVQLVGLVVDMFASTMIDVANEFGVPSYVFFTSSAGFLGLVLYLPTHYDRVGSEFDESDTDESIIPSYINPVPTNVLPSFVFNKEGHGAFLSHARKFKETSGIVVNTFVELESHTMNSFLLDGETLPVYTVGPLLDLIGVNKSPMDQVGREKIMKWLDAQPTSSVIFLCFGSMGCFDEPQLREIAFGLEQSGHRFLWSIRRPPPKGKHVLPSEYDDPKEILPPRFLERIGERGMVCGWAPQVEVLAHPATGGFVSHCGWNSILESLWYSVPIVAWPMYAEQQINGFEMVKDLGLGIELKLDYRKGTDLLVMRDEIEKAVRCVMNDDNEVRKRVKEMGEKSRKVVMEGGSSAHSFEKLIMKMFGNVP